MKSVVSGLMLIPILVLGLDGRGFAQLPPAPQPTLSAAGPCPAVARFNFDVSSVADADRIRWQLRRGNPGQNFGAATQVDDGELLGTVESVELDLRAYGPVLDGTRYFFRIRARNGGNNGNNVSGFSQPVRFDLDLSPDGMFTATAGAVPGSLRVDWNLSGEIGTCADRVALRIDKADGSASVTETGNGPAGTATRELSASGGGDYDVRVQARFGGATADDAVGRESAPVRVAIGPPAVELTELRVLIQDAVAAGCKLTSTVPEATVRVVATAPSGAAFDETAVAKDGSTGFKVPIGGTYQLTATSTRCVGPAIASVTATGPQEVVLTFPPTAGCHDPTADVQAGLIAPSSAPASTPIALQVGLRHTGAGGPSQGGRLRVLRILPDGTVDAELANTALAPFCTGESRSISVTDPGRPSGPWRYRAVAQLPDAVTANNQAERTVSVLEPRQESATAVTIAVTSFRLQGGAATVPTATPITLDATFSGGPPDQYKTGLCGDDFTAAAFQAFPATPPPTLPGFGTAGTRIVCFQARRGMTSTAVAQDTIQVVAPGPPLGGGEGPLASVGMIALFINARDVTFVNARIQVRISGPIAGPVTVSYATEPGTATGGTCGTEGADFATTTGTLTFTSGGPTIQDIEVPICGDTLDEPNETFTVTLSNATNAIISGATSTVTIFRR